MRALLLAAGLGTRLLPLTKKIPKCLVPINGRPLLGYWFDLLFEADIEKVLVNLHYLPEKVKTFIRESQYQHRIKTVFENQLLGTAGTLLANKSFFQGQAVLLVHADNYSMFDVREFMAAHNDRPKGCEMTMMTFETDMPENCGIVELDEKGIVQKFYEKVKHPPGNLANGAVYIVEPSVFSFLQDLGKTQIDFSTQVLPHYLGRIFTFKNSQYHRDIGTLESYQKAQGKL
ncbi:MAG: nucleotidyltransferase family protein [Pseudomonadota bacterium]